MDGKDLIAGGLAFGIRKQENRNSPLKVSKDSQRIRKPPLPLPQVQYRPPVIIHTYSPKVLHTEPGDFMSLVQKLTGSSDTRLRLKKMKPAPKKKVEKAGEASGSRTASNPESATTEPIQHSAGGASIQRQGSVSPSAMSNCGSPTSSEDSATIVVTDSTTRNRCGELATVVKQSDSPRSPFDSDFEFDNNDNLSMFSHFDGPSPAVGTMLSSSQVKTKALFSYTENLLSSPSNHSFSDFMHPTANSKLPGIAPKLSRSQTHPQDGMSSFNIDSMTGFLHPVHLLAGLPDLSTGWPSQSNYQPNYLDCLPSTPLINQAPYLRQRQFAGGYAPVPEGTTLVALENLHTFSST